MRYLGHLRVTEWSFKHCLCKISVTCLTPVVKWPWHHNERVDLVTSQTNEFTTSSRGELAPPVHNNAVKLNVLLKWCMTPITPRKGFSHDQVHVIWMFGQEKTMRSQKQCFILKSKADQFENPPTNENIREDVPVFHKFSLLFYGLILNWHGSV